MLLESEKHNYFGPIKFVSLSLIITEHLPLRTQNSFVSTYPSYCTLPTELPFWTLGLVFGFSEMF